jgi:hypothetical protein
MMARFKGDVIPVGGIREAKLVELYPTTASREDIVVALNAIPEGREVTYNAMAVAANARLGMRRPWGRGRFARRDYLAAMGGEK